MAKIPNDYTTQVSGGFTPNAETSAQKQAGYAATKELPPDEFVRREKRKNNGLIERLYNKIKNATGLGTGSEKVEKVLAQLKNGEITQNEFEETVQNYSSSQENSAQILGDAASIAASGFTFFGLNKVFKYSNAWVKTNKPVVKELMEGLDSTKEYVEKESQMGNFWKKSSKFYINLMKKMVEAIHSNKKMTIMATVISALAGGSAKKIILKMNRAGSDEFKIDKQIYGEKKDRTPADKQAVKAEKKRLKKERKHTDLKNYVSGAINGLMMPVFALGGIIGAPVYLIGNSLNRYFVGNKTDKDKSAGGFVNNLKNDSIPAILLAAGAAIPLIKKGNWTKVFNDNMAKVVKKLENAELKEPKYGTTTVYKRLESEMLDSPNVRGIINDGTLTLDDKIRQLTAENIFAVKFKQISGDGSELARALKDKCPPTRTLDQAQEFVDRNLGSGYKLSNLLGVGTVAETYFAKSPEGKEVCIKILKDGISENKIKADKEKFVQMVKNMPNVSTDEMNYLLRNVDDLADGILREANLKNEMDNALNLVKSTKVANVVKPIEVKNNVYVMEGAKGVSLASFMDLNKLYTQRKALLEYKADSKIINQIDSDIKFVKSRMPGFEDVSLRKEDVEYLLKEYQRVFIEQFHKIDKNGKVIHADIHPGNIFIDPQVLRTRKGKLFTLIDTGNVVDMGMEQSMRALNFSKYVKQGNVKNIAVFVLDGAKLPAGMTQKQAMEKIEAELKTCFFDSETKIEMLNDEKVLALTDNIMQKYDIIPSSTQLNLNKSRTSAKNSLKELKHAIAELNSSEILKKYNESMIKGTSEAGIKGIEKIAKNHLYNSAVKKQEKDNLKQLSKLERLKHNKNTNAPKTNSEDYITYKVKQLIQE